MTKPSNLSAAEREELVAFLDGELPDDAASKVEAKLNVDGKTRAEADALRKTWDLLDYLPKPEPSPNFTHRTLDRLEPMRTQSVPRRRPVLRAALLGLAWAASLLVALAAGYGIAALWLQHGPNDKDLVRDLRLLENKRLYDVGEDMDFLRELDKPELFGEEVLGS